MCQREKGRAAMIKVEESDEENDEYSAQKRAIQYETAAQGRGERSRQDGGQTGSTRVIMHARFVNIRYHRIPHEERTTPPESGLVTTHHHPLHPEVQTPKQRQRYRHHHRLGSPPPHPWA